MDKLNNGSTEESDIPITEPYVNRSFVDGKWFREVNDGWNGYSLSLGMEKVLFHQKSEFQDVLVFNSTSFGNVLVLDGIIQCTERDEFTYQEMICHLPMNIHPNPEKVLVIGGGDGGCVREVLKYSSVQKVVLAEIDQMVVDVSKIHLPDMASCLRDPRVDIQICDGLAYVSDHPGEFDVIITDAPDPVGPAVDLFGRKFCSKLKAALTSDGVICCQGESPFFDIPFVSTMLRQCKELFPKVGYATGNTPTYASGIMGYMVASLNSESNLAEPVRQLTDADIAKMNLKYYNSQLHRSCFVLPTYMRKELEDVVDT